MNILDVFTYNQHFVAMMNIINNARLCRNKTGHKHHIIPRCWFKMMDLPIDNSKSNLVVLTPEEHLKVHQLTSLCVISTYIKGAMLAAVGLLGNGERPLGIHPSAETKAKIRNSVHAWYDNNMEEHIERTKEGMSKVPYDKLAYWKGKKLSEEHRRKIGAASALRPCPNKGKHWKLVDGRRVYYGE